ncbi:hypothetical protein ARTHRO_10601 [Limnospira indica PCC 8005]|uniref:Uncharacterized protein n=1 Tax=Limnospira indica PCC 8005 TaxID=376219 RepID=A0A9P1NWS5_9CYAN|nr:hypothetical protein ARTHRO_10601 [Limnospira indica PCC 8005]
MMSCSIINNHEQSATKARDRSDHSNSGVNSPDINSPNYCGILALKAN